MFVYVFIFHDCVSMIIMNVQLVSNTCKCVFVIFNIAIANISHVTCCV